MKTAVEWLMDKLPKSIETQFSKQIEQAKEMENKQQEGFAYWCEWRDDRAFKTYDELLKIYKNETKR